GTGGFSVAETTIRSATGAAVDVGAGVGVGGDWTIGKVRMSPKTLINFGSDEIQPTVWRKVITNQAKFALAPTTVTCSFFFRVPITGKTVPGPLRTLSVGLITVMTTPCGVAEGTRVGLGVLVGVAAGAAVLGRRPVSSKRAA